ncbi:hypothetical protein VKS41_006688 [Umbelopsis sp. WA50703]
MSPATTQVTPATKEATIMLWTHPRSRSTAFERVFIHREDIECFHEPYGDSYYYGETRVSKRFDEEHCKAHKHSNVTYESVTQELLNGTQGKRVFAKDMAYYLYNSESRKLQIPRETLTKMYHTFLIRTPEKSIPSYYRLCKGDTTTFDHFDPSEAGYTELRWFFDLIRNQTGVAPIVLDAEELVKHPKELMKKYCEAIDLDFSPDMLEWQPATVKQFDKWSGWHEEVQQSTGFGQYANANKQDDDMPAIVQDTIKANMPDFEYLQQFALKL